MLSNQHMWMKATVVTTLSLLFVKVPIEINESLYELHRPQGDPEVDIIFFHRLQRTSYNDAEWKTWSRDGKSTWLQDFLGAELPNARILTVRYDSCARRSATTGRLDVYLVGENLVTDILESPDANVGRDGRPVILVGHSLGGLVLKQFVLMADDKRHKALAGMRREILANFLDHNLCGVFYYGTPHGGSLKASMLACVPGMGPMVNFLSTFNKDCVRLNNQFLTWRQMETHKVPTYALAESNATLVCCCWYNQIVGEDSARQDVDDYNTIRADHYSICKPESIKSSSYLLLKWFVVEKVLDKKNRQLIETLNAT